MRKLLQDIFYNAIYQVFLLLVPFITLPYLSRVLGPEKLGTYSSVNFTIQFIIVFGAAAMGQVGVRTIANAVAKKNSVETHFWQLYRIQFIMSAIMLGCYGIFITFLTSSYQLYYMLSLPVLLATLLDISWFFIGIQQIKKVVTRNTLIKLSSVILILLLVKKPNDLWIYFLINSLTLMLGNLVFWIALKKHIHHYSRAKNQFLKMNLKAIFIIMIPQIATQVYTALDKPFLLYFSNATQVSYYDYAQKIARIVLALITSITIVMMPKMASSTKDEQKKYLRKSLDVTLFFALLFLIIIIPNTKEFVPLFFGKEFIPMTFLMQIISLIIVIIPVGGVFSNQFALAINKDKEYAIPVVTGAVLSILLSFVLVKNYASLGSTINLLIVETIVCFLRIFLVRKEFNFHYTFQDFIKYFLIAAVSLLVGFCLPNLIQNAFFDMVYKSIVIIFIYLTLFFIGRFDLKKDIVNLFKKIRKSN